MRAERSQAVTVAASFRLVTISFLSFKVRTGKQHR